MSINTAVENILGKLYDGTLVTGLDLIKKIRIVVTVRGAYDPDLGGSTDTVTSYTVNAIVRGFTLQELGKLEALKLIERGDLRVSIGRQQTGIPDDLDSDALILMRDYGDDIKSGTPTLTIASGVATPSEAQGDVQVGAKITYDTNSSCWIKTINSTTEFVVVDDDGADTIADEAIAVSVDSIKNDTAYKIMDLDPKTLGSTDLQWIVVARRK